MTGPDRPVGQGKALALWTCPRSVSTAFEVMMMERGDLRVFHEPYGPCYYMSADRSSDRKADEPDQPENTYARVTARLLAAVAEGPVFFKDMPYYVEPILDGALVDLFHNTILIRDPARLLPSLYKAWPDFTMAETGYPTLHRLAMLEKERSGRMPVILDAGDLLADPAGMAEAYCTAVGLPFLPRALTWEAKERPELNWWEGGSWHGAVSQSVGFTVDTSASEPLPESSMANEAALVQEAYAICAPLYRELYESRLRVICDVTTFT